MRGRRTDVEEIRDPVLGERVFKKVFPSGFTAYVVRKPEFTKSYATVATRYGSVDTTLGGGRRLPDGIAHFLEHKVFETPRGDAFDLFAALGASANASTSFGWTQYLFGTSTRYGENLRILLDMVFDLHVTEAGVEKEKGIIGQEIAMYDDDPEWRIYFGALQGMYARHPVRVDIAGTQRTIARIDAGLLRAVHAAYYHPRLMALAAVSPEPPSATLAAVEERVESRRFPRAAGRRGALPPEGRRVKRRSVRVRLPVARPKVLLACKDVPPARPGRTQLRHELASKVALDCLFGNSGSVYLKLYEDGLVDDSFACSYSAEAGCAFAMAGGETDHAGRLQRALEREVDAALARGIDADAFERVRNKVLGGYARAFNSPERIAHLLMSHHLRGTSVPDTRDALFALTRAQVDRRLREMLLPASRCYSVVLPRKGDGAAR